MADYQITYNGLTIGASTPYGLVRLSGLHDLPEVRTGDQNRARAHGQWLTPDYLGGRNIAATITVTSQHPSNATWQALSQALVSGQSVELPLTVQVPGLANGNVIQANARVRRLSLPVDMDYTFGVGRAEVEWHCTDPRLYSQNATTLTTTQATSSGGLVMPITFPITFGSGASGGLVVATNAGEFTAPWTATITGPVTNPRIENVTTGQILSFVGSLSASDTLVIDSLAKTVLLGGTASRYSWLAQGSTWFDLAVGDNQIRFAGTSGTGSMAFTFRSVWI